MKLPRIRRFLPPLLALGLAGLGGCALFGGKPKPSVPPEQQVLDQLTPAEPEKTSWFGGLFGWMKREPAPPKARPLNAVGRIFVFNAEKKYAVIESPGAATLPPGTALAVVQDGNLVARLEVSPQLRPPFLIADLKTGKAQKGDAVYIIEPQ